MAKLADSRVVKYQLKMIPKFDRDSLLSKHSFLIELTTKPIWPNQSVSIISKSTKTLGTDEFILLIDDCISLGCLYLGLRNTSVKFASRTVSEENEVIHVVDRGQQSSFNDVPGYPDSHGSIEFKFSFDRKNKTFSVQRLKPH